MPTFKTPLGSITAMDQAEFYPTGTLKSCVAIDASPLVTEYGILVPQFSSHSERKRQLPCMSFHENGKLNVLPLEEQAVITTPLGEFPAEKVTFHPDGSVKRIFPLDGCLSGFWELSDEIKLAKPIRVETPCGPVEQLIISLYFGPQGNLRSLTFWPGERLKVQSPVGPMTVRIGISFYDAGQIKSIEPAMPVAVKTPIGNIVAYDPDAHGISGDKNSLRFDESGNVTSLVTVTSSFDISEPDGSVQTIEAPMRTNAVDGETLEPSPVTVTFKDNVVTFSADGMPETSAAFETVQAKGLIPLFG